ATRYEIPRIISSGDIVSRIREPRVVSLGRVIPAICLPISGKLEVFLLKFEGFV
ncbi:hypothetical protein J6590_093361, partial [Homalodisca vitripennis]